MNILKPLLLSTALSLATFASAEARTHALLIGVSDYNVNGIHDLKGPPNDVSILWRALKHRDVKDEDIAVLTDPVLPVSSDFPMPRGLPHRAQILAELDRLAIDAQKGDTVIFYYSGHGSVQPVNPDIPQEEPEADGQDQVILPGDVGAYSLIDRSIKNAIVDNELAAKFDRIRARGAFVWAVVDACHSGTVTRGQDVTRSVDPAVLGVPSAVKLETHGGEREAGITLKPGAGGIVGFYAVESYAEAIERPFTGYNLPMVGVGEDQRMGVFTYNLHRALMRDTASTFRDLAQEIVSEMSSDRTGGKVPPPVFDGDLDAPVPGSDAARVPNSVTAILADEEISIPAGILHGFDIGATIALYQPGSPEKPVARATVGNATAVTSKAAEIEWLDEAAKSGAGTFQAVVETPGINFRFVVSPPPDSDFASDGQKQLIAATLQAAFAGDGARIGIELGAAGNPDADLILRVKNDRLWVVRPDLAWVETPGAYDETPSLAISAETAKFAPQVKNAIWSLARAAKLIRVAAGLGEASSGDDGITLKATMRRIPGQDPRGSCPKEPPENAVSSAVEPLLPVATGNCDFVEISVTNETDEDYYVSGFYVDSLGGIAALPTNSVQNGCVRTLISDGQKDLRFRFWISTWDKKKNRPTSVGTENFVILASPKGENRQPPKLCSLTQPTLEATQATREVELPGTRGEKNALASLLGDVEGSATRGVSAVASDDEGPGMSGRLFVFDVKP